MTQGAPAGAGGDIGRELRVPARENRRTCTEKKEGDPGIRKGVENGTPKKESPSAPATLDQKKKNQDYARPSRIRQVTQKKIVREEAGRFGPKRHRAPKVSRDTKTKRSGSYSTAENKGEDRARKKTTG